LLNNEKSFNYKLERKGATEDLFNKNYLKNKMFLRSNGLLVLFDNKDEKLIKGKNFL